MVTEKGGEAGQAGQERWRSLLSDKFLKGYKRRGLNWFGLDLVD